MVIAVALLYVLVVVGFVVVIATLDRASKALRMARAAGMLVPKPAAPVVELRPKPEKKPSPYPKSDHVSFLRRRIPRGE